MRSSITTRATRHEMPTSANDSVYTENQPFSGPIDSV